VDSSEDIDITIVSLASQDSQTTTLPLVTAEDDSATERTAKLVENTSTLWQGRNDADTHLPTDHSGLSLMHRSPYYSSYSYASHSPTEQ
jgi:hypothetical protein